MRNWILWLESMQYSRLDNCPTSCQHSYQNMIALAWKTKKLIRYEVQSRSFHSINEKNYPSTISLLHTLTITFFQFGETHNNNLQLIWDILNVLNHSPTTRIPNHNYEFAKQEKKPNKQLETNLFLVYNWWHIVRRSHRDSE